MNTPKAELCDRTKVTENTRMYKEERSVKMTYKEIKKNEEAC